MKKKNIFLKLSALFAVVGGALALGDHIYKLSSDPHEHEDHSGEDPLITRGREFVRNHPFKTDLFIESYDELKLHACLIPAQTHTHRYVILVHGIWDDNEGNGIFARHYLNQGISCLLPDNRGFGKSEGSYIGYGLDDSLDIMEWIYYILDKDPEASIILHGMSMGAATVLMAGARNLPKNVKCIISDSSYTTLREQFAATYKTLKGSFIPIPFVLFLSRIMIKLRSGFDINDVSPIEAVTESSTPTLFIHGDNDHFIDPQMCSRLYEAATCPKQYCMILGAEHIQGVLADPTNYWNKIDAFVKKFGL